MKNLISSKDNSIQPNGAIGKQKCGIKFWQKTGFLRHCNYIGFQSMIALINKKFSPSNIQNHGEYCFIQFDNNDKKIIYLSLKQEPNSKHSFIYGESHTVYADSKFHMLALDIVSSTYTSLDQGFGDTDAGKWLQEHSREYGFILRYPKDKEYITSIEFEPWHFRYVGVEAATIIMDQGITLEEFVESLE